MSSIELKEGQINWKRFRYVLRSWSKDRWNSDCRSKPSSINRESYINTEKKFNREFFNLKSHTLSKL